jgi:hypothetical protein
VLIRQLRIAVEETNAQVDLHVAKVVLISVNVAVAAREAAMTDRKEVEVLAEDQEEAQIAVAEELTEVAEELTVEEPEAALTGEDLVAVQIAVLVEAQGKNRIE